jgi:PAS domain S-box-containing protein
MIENNTSQGKSFNPWHFIWISVVISELFTALISMIQHRFVQGIDLLDMLRVGAIDSLFVPMIVAPIIIYFMRNESVLKKMNAQLEYEIAQRILTEEALRASESRLRVVTENAPDVIAELDRNGHFTFMSRVLDGYDLTDVLGQDFCKWTPQEYHSVMRNALDQVFITNEPKDYEAQGTGKGGEMRWYLVRLAPILADSQVERAILVARDITARKEAEEALRALNNRLEVDVAERTASLMAANERLRSLSVHLQKVGEQERGRIAREVHDELGQSLTAMRMELSLLRKVMSEDLLEAAEKAESMDKMLESTMHAVKRISLELRPGILDHLGLTAAMEWQAEEFERRTGISCTVSFKPATIDLDNDMTTAVFRIFQETLTNVARHADASMIDARLSVKDHVLSLQVQDNGVGMKESQINGEHSFGLVGIQERILVWGGKLEIESEPGKRTTVNVQIPLEMDGTTS